MIICLQPTQKTKLKADVLDMIDDWILEEIQMASAHGAGSGEA